MKYTKITSWFLALSMFIFGVLKFVNPFKGWYRIQIANSELGALAYAMGIMGEIAVGTTLVLCLLYREKLSTKAFNLLTNTSFFIVILMMLAGVYVHLHPNVPADVLPLNIKPPYIPIVFLLIALSNLYLSIQRSKRSHSDNRGTSPLKD